jgi:hypothetical protein
MQRPLAPAQGRFGSGTVNQLQSRTQSATANFYSRSHDAVIRVYDEAGNVIETHEQKDEFKEP